MIRSNMWPPEPIEVQKTLKISRHFHANRSQISKTYPKVILFSLLIPLDQAQHPHFFPNQIRAIFWLLDLFKVWKFGKVYKSRTCFTQTALKNPKLNILQFCFRFSTQFITLPNIICSFGMIWQNSRIPEPKNPKFALDSTRINLKPPKLNRFYFGFFCIIDYVILNNFLIHCNMIQVIS